MITPVAVQATVPPTDLRLLGLLVENVKRVKLVHIQPRTSAGLVEIAGKNEQGKSTTLQSLAYALGGKEAIPPKPLRTGTTKGRVVVELADKTGKPALRITRSFTPTDSHIAVERIGGGKISRPQEFLDALNGAGLGFDPMAFSRQKGKDQVDQLLALVKLEDDPRALDKQRAEIFTQRADVNRDVKRLEAQLAGLPAVEAGVPDVEAAAELVSVAALAQEQERLAAIQRGNDQVRRDREGSLTVEREWIDKVTRLRRELEEAEGFMQEAILARERMDRVIAGLVDPDVAAITAQIAAAETTNTAALAAADARNVKVRAKLQRRDVTEQLLTKQKGANGLTQQIQRIDDRKNELLAKAQFPVPGLGFGIVGDDYVVTYQGEPFEQASDSGKLKVGFAIAAATNPNVHIVTIREGSLLDEDSRAVVDAMAIEQGYHVLMEIVGDGDPGAFILEDGGLRDVAPAEPVAW